MKTKESDCIAKNLELVQNIQKKLPSEKCLVSISGFYKIIGDFTRIRLLCALEQSQMCVCDLSVLLNMTKSALSHQLKTLKDARLVRSEKIGKHVYYSLNDEHIKSILDIALNHISEAP